MAKSKKSRKYTKKQIPEYIKTQEAMNTNQTVENQVAEGPVRASEDFYMFLDGCKLLIRNLSDIRLLNEHSDITNKIYSIRRELDSLDNMMYQMRKEMNFRNL